MKKSLVTTPSSENFSLVNKNIYQRQQSQESNSKISSASGKDKKYISKRYSQIKNILTESKSSLSLKTGDIDNLQPFTSSKIMVKTNTKDKNDLIDEHIDDYEKNKISEDIADKKRKSSVFNFKYLDKKIRNKKFNIINTEMKKKNKYKFKEEENEDIINEDNNNQELVEERNLHKEKISELKDEKKKFQKKLKKKRKRAFIQKKI